MITISAKKDNKIIKSTRCFTISDDTSFNYKVDNKHFDLRCGKNGEKNKHNFKYNTELVDKDKQLKYIKLFEAKSIYIDESMFNKASLSGYVGTKDSGKVIALENAKIELWDTDKLFADYKYETVTALNGKPDWKYSNLNSSLLYSRMRPFLSQILPLVVLYVLTVLGPHPILKFNAE